MSKTYNGLTHEKILENLSYAISDMDEFEHYGIGDELLDVMIALKYEWGLIHDEKSCLHEAVKRVALRNITDSVQSLFYHLQSENEIKSGDIRPEDEWELDELKDKLADLVAKVISHAKDF